MAINNNFTAKVNYDYLRDLRSNAAQGRGQSVQQSQVDVLASAFGQIHKDLVQLTNVIAQKK